MTAAIMTFLIDNVDFTSYLAASGLKWSRNDIDASKSGRNMVGTDRRKRVTTKRKLQFSCRPLTTAESVAINTALDHETVSITFLDAETGAAKTATFYGSSAESTACQDIGGEVYWTNMTFNLIEV